MILSKYLKVITLCSFSGYWEKIFNIFFIPLIKNFQKTTGYTGYVPLVFNKIENFELYMLFVFKENKNSVYIFNILFWFIWLKIEKIWQKFKNNSFIYIKIWWHPKTIQALQWLPSVRFLLEYFWEYIHLPYKV